MSGGPGAAMSFEEALDVLQGMFATWPRQALGQMLQANQLNMELTVESILAVGAPPPGIGATPSPSRGAGPTQTSRGVNSTTAGGRPTDLPGDKPSALRGAKVTLPDDFLRVPGKAMSASQQILLDEQLAIMLQDEMFLRELEGMPEFDQYTRGAGRYPGHTGSRPARARAGSTGGHHQHHGSDSDSLAAMKQNINEMGDQMKRKLTSLYHRFRNRDDTSHIPLMDTGEPDDEGEMVLFTNSDNSRRSPSKRRQEVEMGEMSRSGGGAHRSSTSRCDDEEEEEVVLGDDKKFV